MGPQSRSKATCPVASPSPSPTAPSSSLSSSPSSSSPPSMWSSRPFPNGWHTTTASSSTTSLAPSSCVILTRVSSVTVAAAFAPVAEAGAETCDGGGGSRWRMSLAPMWSAAASNGSRRVTHCASSTRAPTKSSRLGFTASNSPANSPASSPSGGVAALAALTPRCAR